MEPISNQSGYSTGKESGIIAKALSLDRIRGSCVSAQHVSYYYSKHTVLLLLLFYLTFLEGSCSVYSSLYSQDLARYIIVSIQNTCS